MNNRDVYRERIRKDLSELFKDSQAYPAVDFVSLSNCIGEMLELPPDLRVGRWLDRLLALIENQRGFSSPNLIPLETGSPLHSWLKDQRLRIQKVDALGFTNELQLRARALTSIGYDFSAPPVTTTKPITPRLTSSPTKLSSSPPVKDPPESKRKSECESTPGIESIDDVRSLTLDSLDGSSADEDSLSSTEAGENFSLF